MRSRLLWLMSWLCGLSTSLSSPAAEAELSFDSQGIELSGTLVLPDGEPRAGVVFVHGSGKQTRSLHWARRFAAAGIAAVVYDKRGTGASGGVYESDQSVSGPNIALLASDAVAAATQLSRHPAMKDKPIGLAGISQAGWIAPLAARRTPIVKFLVLWSGPVCKVSEEDIYSKHTSDREGGTVPSYSQALRARKTPYLWPAFLGRDTDSAEDLEALEIPGLWIFSDNDGSVPVDLSLANLRRLRLRGHAYDYALFSGLGHDNMDPTFTVATDWIGRMTRP